MPSQQTATPTPEAATVPSAAEQAAAAARAAEVAAQEAAGVAAAQAGVEGVTVSVPGAATGPTAVYEALKAQRTELREQLRRIERQRDEITGELRRADERGMSEAEQKGLEARLAGYDERIVQLDKEIATADAAVAKAAAIPGAVVPEPPPVYHDDSAEELAAIGIFAAIVVLMPLSIAYARRLWKRSSGMVAALPAELGQRFGRLEQAVDAMAIEIERISEGQRFMTRLFSDRATAPALGARAAEADLEPTTPLP